MRNLILADVNQHRVRTAGVRIHYGSYGDHEMGVFQLSSPMDGGALKCIASSGEGWDHVSISRKNRVPNWYEMDYVKRMFFEDHEVAMQLHVAVADHINISPNVLHLWRPHNVPIPLPPYEFV